MPSAQINIRVIVLANEPFFGYKAESDVKEGAVVRQHWFSA
jgi:hypothetical protein